MAVSEATPFLLRRSGCYSPHPRRYKLDHFASVRCRFSSVSCRFGVDASARDIILWPLQAAVTTWRPATGAPLIHGGVTTWATHYRRAHAHSLFSGVVTFFSQ